MQLVGLVKELLQQNVAMEWEINKMKPKPVTVEDIISKTEILYKFVTSD